MINLLPPQEKERILQEVRLKKIVIFNLVLVFSMVSLALLFLAIEINLNAKLLFRKAILEQRQREFESSQIKELEREIVAFNRILKEFSSFYQERHLLSFSLRRLKLVFPSDLDLTRVSFSRENLQLSVAGYAPTREELLEFKHRLEQDQGFFEVIFPPENWIRPAEIDFSAKFRAKQ